MIQRFDRAPFSYRPGEPLAAYTLYFDHAANTGFDDKFEIAHAAYRLRQSSCFRASQMTCTTCHNPHRAPRGKEAASHYESVCRQCHQSPHEKTPATLAQGTCTDCHMPKRRTDDAVHVVMTDHLIQRQNPRRNLTAAKSESGGSKRYQGEVVLYYPRADSMTPSDELYLAAAQVQYKSNLAAGIERLRIAIEKHNPKEPIFAYELARAYGNAGNRGEAIRWHEKTLLSNPEFHASGKELGAVLLADGQFARSAGILEKHAGNDPSALVNLANAYLRQGFSDRARETAQRALTLDPDNNPDVYVVLGLTSLDQQDSSAAEKHFRYAVTLQPDLVEAQYNLAKLLASRGDYRRAEYHASKAIAINPTSVEARYTRALLFLAQGQKRNAIAELREVVRLAPKFAPAHNDLGDVLVTEHRTQEAIGEYQHAIAANPEFLEAHLSLGLTLLRKGEVSNQARESLQKAAGSADPEIKQAALTALRGFRDRP